MKKFKKIFIKNKFENLIFILLPVGLFFIFSFNIPALTTVWEIPDEAGYLSNVAFFLNYDWGDVRARMPFYGYGYSVFLIPAFFLCKTGIDLIHSAFYLNIVFLICIYFLQICIMKHLFLNGNTIHFALISFVTCLNPYLVSNVLKVNCEVCLTLWVWILIFFLYKSIVSGYKRYYCLLGIVSAYIFFIHTRGIITIGATYLVLVFISIAFHKKNIKKNTLFSVLTMGMAFVIFYMVKSFILEYANALSAQQGESASSVNLITPEYLISRFEALFEPQNLEIYIKGFLARCFYIIYSTGTVVGFGIIGILISLKRIKNVGKENDGEVAVYGIKLFFVADAIAMILAATINNPGRENDFTYFFYNRYYEHTIIPLMAYGICECLYKFHYCKKMAFYCLTITFISLTTISIDKYLVDTGIKKDTNRISGFTSAVSQTDSFSEMIQYATMIMLLIVIIYCVINYFRISRWVFISLVVLFIWWSDSININLIKEIHMREKKDTDLIEYIYSLNENQKIYALDIPSPYNVNYVTRLQVLLKNQKLYIVPTELISSISSGSYIFINHDGVETNLLNYLMESCDWIGDGKRFDLYQKK